MPIQAHELLTFAKQLRSGEKSEIELRSAASRAYYSALHTVDLTFLEFGPKLNGRDESSHDRIIGKALHHARESLPGKNDAALIAKLMPQIKRIRTVADYELEDIFLNGDADEAIGKAVEICRRCISVRTQLQNKANQAPSSSMDIPVLSTDANSEADLPSQPPPQSPRPPLKRIR